MKKLLFYINLLAIPALLLFSCTSDQVAPKSAAPNGRGGSMARFAVSGNFLYTVDNSNLNLFDISTPSNPQKQKQIPLSFGVETIFPYGDKLFIGTQLGMHIFSIQDPAAPQHLSLYQHVYSCDPVVTDGRYAYVTLSTGTACKRAINQLQILDLENINNPVLIKQYDMKNPKGLGIDNNNLFVCDDGLKMYDATNPSLLQLKQHYQINAYDVIAAYGRLLVIGSDGFYQYEYNNEALTLMSKISVQPAL